MSDGSREMYEIAAAGGERIVEPGIRRLYEAFCRSMLGISPAIRVEPAVFETRFTGPGGMLVKAVPYRELFLVSAGSDTPCQVRVTGEDAFCRALDLSLQAALSSLSSALTGGPGGAAL